MNLKEIFESQIQDFYEWKVEEKFEVIDENEPSGLFCKKCGSRNVSVLVFLLIANIKCEDCGNAASI